MSQQGFKLSNIYAFSGSSSHFTAENASALFDAIFDLPIQPNEFKLNMINSIT